MAALHCLRSAARGGQLFDVLPLVGVVEGRATASAVAWSRLRSRRRLPFGLFAVQWGFVAFSRGRFRDPFRLLPRNVRLLGWLAALEVAWKVTSKRPDSIEGT